MKCQTLFSGKLYIYIYKKKKITKFSLQKLSREGKKSQSPFLTGTAHLSQGTSLGYWPVYNGIIQWGTILYHTKAKNAKNHLAIWFLGYSEGKLSKWRKSEIWLRIVLLQHYWHANLKCPVKGYADLFTVEEYVDLFFIFIRRVP